MRPVPRPHPGLDDDELASDVAYAAATVALQRDGRPPGDVPATQLAGIVVSAAAPYIARDLLRRLADEPWWRRWRVLPDLLAQSEIRVREQGELAKETGP